MSRHLSAPRHRRAGFLSRLLDAYAENTSFHYHTGAHYRRHWRPITGMSLPSRIYAWSRKFQRGAFLCLRDTLYIDSDNDFAWLYALHYVMTAAGEIHLQRRRRDASQTPQPARFGRDYRLFRFIWAISSSFWYYQRPGRRALNLMSYTRSPASHATLQALHTVSISFIARRPPIYGATPHNTRRLALADSAYHE